MKIGKLEKQILNLINFGKVRKIDTNEIAYLLKSEKEEKNNVTITKAEYNSVNRALLSLERKGLIVLGKDKRIDFSNLENEALRFITDKINENCLEYLDYTGLAFSFFQKWTANECQFAKTFLKYFNHNQFITNINLSKSCTKYWNFSN